MDSFGVVGFVGAGILWRAIRLFPAAEQLRQVIATAVFMFFLPVLTFRSMLHAPLGSVLWQIPLVAASSIIGTALTGWLLCRTTSLAPPAAAAFVLTSAWGNVTYLGIPLLRATIAPEATYVAVLFDFAASTPLLWTLGVGLIHVIAGPPKDVRISRLHWLAIPPLWAAIAGLSMQALGIALPAMFDRILEIIAAAVIPLMMFALGLSLRWEYLRQWRMLVPVATLKLLVAPAIATVVSLAVGLGGIALRAAILEAAMPTMMLTLVVAERYHLESERVAAAIAVTTITSVVTLPLWWLVGSMLA
ncbi:MAG: AEC family transporter [Bacteroidota bacterium]|nr:AEC family transporter [Candidatus Kapabacteria bacterium]MCS7302858.1 AEC family transporter [Candidatus Kapabacteria bacterium]MCX7937165.1 AEC family transporter [Chlorobiota bacterium]MDW8075242.1 AEC family transporter [Bacteroidota bacterium]MDW8271855.1 AEC family transporter [Bacteroidota bacterium]